MSEALALPPGFRAGHFTDREGATGCTVVLPPASCVAAGEVRGGGPGTRESDLLSPASHAPGVQALLLTGGSAFGLHAADGVASWLAERELGHQTPVANVPLVDPFVLEAVAAEAAAAAIRDGVRQATSLAGCPSAGDRSAANE